MSFALGKLFGKSKKPITAEKVRFSYDKKQILSNININFKEAKITAIIGRSGCGKSTFLNLIAGSVSGKFSGKILVFGRHKILEKKKIGFVPQSLSFIPDLSILDNIKLHGLMQGLTEKRSVETSSILLDMLKLDEDLLKTPNTLSGGQKTRLNIVLSLLHDPHILILDEPFVGLDFANRRLLWHFLEKMKKNGKSIILTSHLLSETQDHVDNIVILKDGKVFFNGRIEKLQQKLKIAFVMEIKFLYLSKESLENIKKYCTYHDIKLLDIYGKYAMIAFPTTRSKEYMIRFLSKLKLKYEIISFREPNLDEVFLTT
jgi:ABC-2 type transport system ATP-binding protein